MREIARENKVKKMLKAGEPVVGTFMVSGSRAVLEVLATSGFDFVLIDTEHFLLNNETLEQLITAAEAAGVTPFVRIQENTNLIDRAISGGARGIMIPMCNTKEIAQAAVDVAKYAPIGKRGACNPRAVTFGVQGVENMVDFYKTENENILLIAQIESEEAVKNLPEILTVEGIDTFFIGPIDLSNSMGIPGGFDNDKLLKKIDKASKLVKEKNVPLGILSFNAAQSNEYFEQGYSWVSMGCDMMHMAATAMTELSQINRDIKI